MAREEGIEPPTRRLTAACSTAELLPNAGEEVSKLAETLSWCQESKGPPFHPSEHSVRRLEPGNGF